MDFLKIVLKHLSPSVILQPNILPKFFLHRSLVSLYLRQDVCHLWQRIIKFRKPLMTPEAAEIAHWWKDLFITSRKSARFVFPALSFYSFVPQCHPFQKMQGFFKSSLAHIWLKKKEGKKKKIWPFWTDDSQTCQQWWFEGKPEDASKRKYSKTSTYLWTTHVS